MPASHRRVPLCRKGRAAQPTRENEAKGGPFLRDLCLLLFKIGYPSLVGEPSPSNVRFPSARLGLGFQRGFPANIFPKRKD